MDKQRDYKHPLEMLEYWRRHRGNTIALRQSLGGSWRDYSWREIIREVNGLCSRLATLNLREGSNIAIVSKNCAHWVMADLAIWRSGHISVPLFSTSAPREVAALLEHSQSRAVFVGKLENMDVESECLRRGIPRILLPDYSSGAGIPLEDFKEISQPLTRTGLSQSNIATIIYTSGSTGTPKGVMHAFSSISFAATEAARILECNTDDIFFSYLPLAHVAERLFNEMLWLYSGGTLCFSHSLSSFLTDLRRAQPTRFLAVPRVWLKFQSDICKTISRERLKRLLSTPIIARYTRKKVRSSLGLSRAKTLISGAAPLSANVVEWFAKLDLPIQEGYGMTENFAHSHLNRQGRLKPGSVGQPGPGVEVLVSSSGDLWIKSPANMVGYYREPKLSEKIFVDGYLVTGDRGQIDADGYLKILGREKDSFKLSTGKYVSPMSIENILLCSPFVDRACAVGSGMNRPIALITLSEHAKRLHREQLLSTLESLFTEVTAHLPTHEKIKSLIALSHSWTVANGLLTPTLKLRRHCVEATYSEQFEQWANLRGVVIDTPSELDEVGPRPFKSFAGRVSHEFPHPLHD